MSQDRLGSLAKSSGQECTQRALPRLDGSCKKIAAILSAGDTGVERARSVEYCVPTRQQLVTSAPARFSPFLALSAASILDMLATSNPRQLGWLPAAPRIRQ